VKPASLAMSSMVAAWKPRSAKTFFATAKRSSRRSPCWGRSSVITIMTTLLEMNERLDPRGFDPVAGQIAKLKSRRATTRFLSNSARRVLEERRDRCHLVQSEEREAVLGDLEGDRVPVEGEGPRVGDRLEHWVAEPSQVEGITTRSLAA